MKKLPDKPSELLKLALTDLEKVENNPKYKVDMGEWVRYNGKCRVCLAGAVMVGSMGITENNTPMNGTKSVTPSMTTEGKKLCAIDDFRSGRIAEGFSTMGISLPRSLYVDGYHDLFDPPPQDEWPSYHSSGRREEWRIRMQDLIGVLEAEGL